VFLGYENGYQQRAFLVRCAPVLCAAGNALTVIGRLSDSFAFKQPVICG
jgi:hypothetical protein